MHCLARCSVIFNITMSTPIVSRSALSGQRPIFCSIRELAPLTSRSESTTDARVDAEELDSLAARAVVARRKHRRKSQEAGPVPLLLFMCCHPSLSPASAIPLTLRTIAGLTTAEIARAFMVPQNTMAQRICCAKQSIRSSGIPFPPHRR